MKIQSESISRRVWMGGVGVAAALAGAGAAWWRWRPAAVSSPAVSAFWLQTFTQPQGGALRAAEWRGRPLLVNFWATWCPPCVEELPMIEAFWRENEFKGIQVLALAIDQPSVVRRFLERQSLSFPVALAGLEGAALARSLGNVNGGLPFSVFFGKEGHIWRQKLGQLTPKDLEDWHASVVGRA